MKEDISHRLAFRETSIFVECATHTTKMEVSLDGSRRMQWLAVGSWRIVPINSLPQVIVYSLPYKSFPIHQTWRNRRKDGSSLRMGEIRTKNLDPGSLHLFRLCHPRRPRKFKISLEKLRPSTKNKDMPPTRKKPRDMGSLSLTGIRCCRPHHPLLVAYYPQLIYV